MWFFAGFALLLAVIGIHGIVSYAVVQRTKEMGALCTGSSSIQGLLNDAAGYEQPADGGGLHVPSIDTRLRELLSYSLPCSLL